jgi:hypothetical protein
MCLFCVIWLEYNLPELLDRNKVHEYRVQYYIQGKVWVWKLGYSFKFCFHKHNFSIWIPFSVQLLHVQIQTNTFTQKQSFWQLLFLSRLKTARCLCMYVTFWIVHTINYTCYTLIFQQTFSPSYSEPLVPHLNLHLVPNLAHIFIT